MKILATYFFEIKHRSGKKMGHTDYLSRINQTNLEYPQDRKDAKYVLNVLYNDKGVYGSKRYKDSMKRLIQVPYGKVNSRKTSYQAICKETKKEIGLYTIPVYLITDKDFNCDLYTIDIGERILQWMESNKNGL